MPRHLATAIAIGVAGASGCGISESFDDRVAAESGGSLWADFTFDAGDATVEVMSHDANEVRVELDARGWGASGVKLKLDGKGDDVRVTGRNGGLAPWLFGGPSVEVRVWVPREFSVDVHSGGWPLRLEDLSGRILADADGGELVADGLEGVIDLRTSRGSVRLENAEGQARLYSGRGPIEIAWFIGDVQAQTDRGGIEVREVEGTVDVATARGGIEIRGVDGSVVAETRRGGVDVSDVSGRVEAKSGRGKIRATFSDDPEGSLETARGGIDVALPMDSGVDLDARVSRGDVSIGPGLHFEGERDEGHWIGQVNGGGGALRLYSVRGGIRLSRR